MSKVEPSNISNALLTKLTANYELEKAFLDDVAEKLNAILCNYYIYDTEQKSSESTATETGAKNKKKKKTKENKTPRKTSAYNVFVKEKMQDESVKTVPHQERMGKIGGMWKKMSDEEKSVYKIKADEVNAVPKTN